MRELDDLDPELARLYAAERQVPLAEGATARVLAGVLAGVTASIATPATTTAATATGVSTKAVVAIALASALVGGTVGVVGYHYATRADPARGSAPAPERAPTPDAPVAVPIDAPIETGIDARIAPPADAAGPRTSSGRPATGAASSPEDSTEPLLIEHARTALRRGLVDEALATLMRHERVYPRGALAEERDVLAIEAYVASARPAIAQRRIERYRRDYPDGFLRDRVARAAAAISPQP
jgi:hypothetical protein